MAGNVLASTTVPNNEAYPPGGASIGASTDTGAAQSNINREFAMAGQPGDGNQVDVWDSQDNTTFFFVTTLFGGDRKVVPQIGRYLRTVRQSGTAAVVVQYGDATSPSAGGTAVVNGGQPGPVTVGTTDATTLTLEANSVAGYTQTSAGNVTLGSTTALAFTIVRSGTGGIGVGVAAQGGSSTTIDTSAAAALNLGTANATSLVVGPGALTSAVLRTLAGIIGIGDNASAQQVTLGNVTGATGVRVLTGTNGFALNAALPTGNGATFDTSGAGAMLFGQTNATTIRLGASTTGIGIGVAAPAAPGVTIDTGAAGALILGNTNATTIRVGGASSGIGIGVAAPAAPGVTIDTGAAGTLLLGNTNANAYTLGSGAGVTGTILAATLNVCATAVASTIQIGTGAAVMGVTLGSLNATSTTAIQGGSGATAVTINVGTAAGVIGIASAATATTVSIGNGAAAMTINLGSAGAGVKTINIGTQASVNVINVGSSIATLGFFGATAVVQAAVSTNANRVVAGATAANTESTYDGGLGGNAYTVGGIVLRLKQYGLLS